MADPVSAGAGIVGVIGLAIQISQLLVRFGTAWKDAPENVKIFMVELGALQTVLSVTNTNILLNPEFAAAFENRPSVLLSELGPDAAFTTDTKSMLDTCQRELKSLLRELQKIANDDRMGWERFKAAFRAKSMQNSVENLCRQCQVLNNMVSIDIAVLGATTYKEVRDAREEQRESSLVIRSGVNEANKWQEDQTQQNERRAILDWLTSIDYAAQQSDFIGRRQEGTGQWLIDSAEFQTWLTADAETLFCPGIPGAGKTILTSVVVDELTTLASSDPTIGVGYIYFNFRRQSEQRLGELLRSLLKQLVEGQPSVPEFIKGLHQKSSSRPSIDEILMSLQATMEVYSRTFIIIDALDECQVSDGCRNDLLSKLFDLQRKCNLNIFATSRPISDIENLFTGKPALEIRASESDVRRYLHGRMSRLPDFVKRKPELQKEIEEEVIKAVDGMYVFARAATSRFPDRKTSPKALRATLKNMARGSGAYYNAYGDAMERINGQIKDQAELAKQVLSWITCSKRPLRTAELQHALGVEIGEPELDKENLPDVEDMVSVCAGLVTIDEESDLIRLVHYTAQEYFERTQQQWFPDAEANITEICVTYLSFCEFESGACLNDDDLKLRLESNKFYRYASLNWGNHARHSAALCPGMTNFLQTRRLVDAANEVVWHPVEGWPLSPPSTSERTTGLHLAAKFGLNGAVRQLMKSHRLNEKDSYGRTPLSCAAMDGDESVVQLLLYNKAARKRADDNLLTPLHYASAHRHVDVVRVLLEFGADPNVSDIFFDSPLHYASSQGDLEIVQLLLKYLAFTNKSGAQGMTPLHRAADRGHLEVVRMLLENGAEVDKTDEYDESPLQCAFRYRHIEVITLLLEKGANVNVPGMMSETMLHEASKEGDLDVVRILLEKGADINADDRKGITPLHLASETGNLEVVRILLEKGAVVNATTNWFDRTPLILASMEGHLEVIRTLIEGGSNVDATAGPYKQSPLHCAISTKNLLNIKVMELLLEKNANINLVDARKQTPLYRSSDIGYIEGVQILLEKGADIHTSDIDGRTPLQIASKNGHVEIVKLLEEAASRSRKRS